MQRVSRSYVQGWNAWLPRLLRLPALRCGPCRYKFFSIRPQRRNMPTGPQPQTTVGRLP